MKKKWERRRVEVNYSIETIFLLSKMRCKNLLPKFSFIPSPPALSYGLWLDATF
jgi:hypothetical protein